PAARALVPPNGSDSPSPRQLVEAFVEASIDGLARAWLGGEAGRRTPTPALSGSSRAWLEALRRGELAVRASSFELERLSSRLGEWRAPLVTAASASPYRTCFRLEPPELGDAANGLVAADGGEMPWTLSIFLQATDDPSLLLPAEQVWHERGDTLVYLNRR